MTVKLLFLLGSPRSGSTMLERMLEAHPMILGGPEPHLLTPLAHVGYYAKAEKAPYDPRKTAESVRGFVESLPNKEQDYWAACRAYCEVLYGRLLEAGGKTIFLDKTPAYSLIWPFIIKLFPDARYIVLARHPVATFSSYANSFFGGDYRAAQDYNPLLHRYVPALAGFLRQDGISRIHIRYEDLVSEPETGMRDICAFVRIPFEPNTLDYGLKLGREELRAGFGDPIGVNRYIRPSTESIEKWAGELAGNSEKRRFMEQIISQLDPNDLATLGYPLETLWEPLNRAKARPVRRTRDRAAAYQLQRRLIVKLRAFARRNRGFRKTLEAVRAVCGALLQNTLC
jgi:hypothetical protein